MQNNFQNYKFGIARTPPCSMARGITTQKAIIDVKLARKQHYDYLTVLNDLGIIFAVLDPEENLPDSHKKHQTTIVAH